MNNIDDYSKFESLLGAYLTDTITQEEETTLFALLNENAEYMAHFEEMMMLNAIAKSPAIEQEKDTNFRQNILPHLTQKQPNDNQVSSEKKIKRLVLKYSTIASAMVLGAVIYFATSNPSDAKKLSNNEVIVPKGSKSQIILPDSSVVWLNANSKLTYGKDYGVKNRDVQLEGEALFEVSPNKKNAFRVVFEDATISVKGTTFNVKAYNEDKLMYLDLIEGSVIFSPKDASIMELKPDQRITFDRLTNKTHYEDIDATKISKWINGYLYFSDSSLAEIMHSLERHYNVTINLHSDKIANEKYSGTLDVNRTLSELLKYIDLDNKFIVKEANDIDIYSKWE